MEAVAVESSSVYSALDRAWQAALPPPKLRVSEFSDEHIIVTSGPLAGTRWQTDFAPYQRGILDAFHEDGINTVVVMGSSQWGKALALETPIPTPSGWTTMGALEVDDVVFDERGRPCRVTFVTQVMSNRKCYRVTFCDGSQIIADGDHLWRVESNQWPHWHEKVDHAVMSTAVIAQTFKSDRGGNRYAIATTAPLQLPESPLPVDPYLLGVWLGDGHLLQPAITLHEDDRELIEHLEAAGARVEVVKRTSRGVLTVRIDARVRRPPCPECGRGFPLMRWTADSAWMRIKALGLTVEKTIPAAYLRSSEAQRWALLQGLMDTDGYVEVGGRRCQFTTTSPGLAATFGDLLASLGLKYTSRTKIPSCRNKGKLVRGAMATLFHFTAYREQPVFKLSRKRDRLTPMAGGVRLDGSVRKTRPTQARRRRIVSVDPVASVPVKCITVDSPNHLYLAGRTMIPTHNTSCAINIVAYHMAHDPCSILVVEPTVDPMARDFSKNRLEPIISASPALADVVGKKRAKDASNTTLQKTFRGGSISIGGANSAASLAARTIRLLVLDEVDRFPPELPGEGSTIAVALKRTQAYRRRRRVLMLSSPTVEGAPIHHWFKRGDQRRFFVPCPGCGHMHPYEWRHVRWTDDDPATARVHCPECDYAINDAERVAILAKGEWRPMNPQRRDKTISSFHLWECYSPLSSLSEIVGNFLAAREKQKSGDHSEMHTWQNTTLGEPVEKDQGEGANMHVLLLRREAYLGDGVDVPDGACCLTCGVDVQDDRLEALVIGWGPGEESWIVDRQTLPGDTSQPEPWAALDQLLALEYQHATRQRLMIHSTCIDSAGHRTSMVYDYAESRAARRVYAVIGRDGQRPIVSSPSQKTWGRHGRKVPLYTVGVDAAKALIVSRLRLTEKGPGFVHLPHADWCDEELAAQLTSEKLVTKWTRGVPVQVWKKTRARNEALDMTVYAVAALRLLNPKLNVMLEALRRAAPAAAPNVPAPPVVRPPSQRQRRVWTSDYLG